MQPHTWLPARLAGLRYEGPCGRVSDKFFRDTGCPVPEGYNRADFYIDCISHDYR